jgi:hypothetical protein
MEEGSVSIGQIYFITPPRLPPWQKFKKDKPLTKKKLIEAHRS